MDRADKYDAHARRCMAKAAQAQRAHERRQWLIMANTWLEMVRAEFAATRSADLEPPPPKR
jgi:hypothetical protein